MKTLFTALLFTLMCAGTCTAAVYEAQEVPWSGYWWPHYAGELVNGYRSDSVPPLSKYDLVISGTEKGSAWSCGNKYYNDEDALSWEGLCYCWAAAAINEAEPVSRGTVENVVFNVGDKKGLLTAMWDGSLYDIYDLSDPADFHSLLETYIKEQETAVIINLGSLTDAENYSDEEWNYPVYKYDTSYSVYGDTRHYTTTIYYVLDNVAPDYVGSVIDSKTFQYYIETEDDVIVDSGWEGTNEDTPPLSMRIPYQVDPRCSALDIETVRTIAATADDEFEENDTRETAAQIANGTFTLVAADKDWYTVGLEAGDGLRIDFDNEADQGFLIYLYDAGDNITGYIDDTGRIDLEAAASGSYTIEVAADEGNSEDEPYYTMTVEKSLENSAFLPVVKKGNWNNNISLVSANSVPAERVLLTRFDENGSILSSVELEVDTPVVAGSLADSPFNMEIDNSGYLKIDSDQPLKGYGAVSDGDVRMYGTAAVQADRLSSEIFFTNYAASSGWSTVFSLINTGADEETVTFTAFNAEGEETDTHETAIASREKFAFQPGDLDFTGSETSAVIARTSSGGNVLAGFAEYTFEPSMIFYNGAALVNLNREPAQKMSLPHYASGSWFSGISVMNTSAWNDELLITAYDSNGQNLSETTVLVNARETFICEASSLFPDIDPEEMASLSIGSGSEALLSGHAIYITSDYYKLAGAPLCPLPEGESAEPLLLPLSRWDQILFTGLALSNTGSDQLEADIILYSESGGKIDETAVTLDPNARFTGTLSALFGESAISGAEGYVVIDPGNSQGLKGIFILGGEDTLFGDAF